MTKSKIIYLDYQASTPICKDALDKMIPCLTNKYANPHSTQHILGINSYQAIEDAKSKIARLINADDNEIIFTSGATEANNLALFGICNNNSIRKKILISSIEHKSIIAPAEHLISLGFNVEYIPVDSEGLIKLDKYRKLLSDEILLVSIMMVNNEIGTIQNIKECADLAKSYGSIFHTDAAQAPVTKAIDVKELNVDLLSLSSHKMYGPKGIGALYVSNQLQKDFQPMIHGGKQQNGLRSGTLPTHLCIGFGEASNYILKNRMSIINKTKCSRNYFWKSISSKINNISLIGPMIENRHAGNLNICFENIDADILLGMLQTKVALSTGSACTAGMIGSSHVLQALNIEYKKQNQCIRFSFGVDMSIALLDNVINFIKVDIEKLIDINS